MLKNVTYNPGGHWRGHTQILRGIQGCFSGKLFLVTICDPFPNGSGLSDRGKCQKGHVLESKSKM